MRVKAAEFRGQSHLVTIEHVCGTVKFLREPFAAAQVRCRLID
jgi:hypothetical protein